MDYKTPVTVRLSKTKGAQVSIPICDKIPTVFTSCDTWPSTTKIACWQCGLHFETTPRFVPTKLNINADDISFYSTGIFCSFACTYSYIIKQHECEPITRDLYVKNLRILYFVIFGIQKQAFLCAPPFTTIIKYGGDETESSYLKKCIAYDMCKTLTDVNSISSVKKYCCEFEQNKPIKRTFKDCSHLFANSMRSFDIKSEWSISVHK
jgi:hypothetical protein